MDRIDCNKEVSYSGCRRAAQTDVDPRRLGPLIWAINALFVAVPLLAVGHQLFWTAQFDGAPPRREVRRSRSRPLEPHRPRLRHRFEPAHGHRRRDRGRPAHLGPRWAAWPGTEKPRRGGASVIVARRVGAPQSVRGQRSMSPRMKASTASWAESSSVCSGGDFMK